MASYAVAAFVIMQVVNEFAPALRLPSWTSTLVALLLLLGFPLTLALAWAFDWTRQGIRPARKDEAAGSEAGSAASSSRIPLGVAAGLTLLLLGGGVWVTVRALGGGLGGVAPSDAGPDELDPAAVAVLPFRVTGGEELAYLREGMIDLLAAKFTGEGGLVAVEPRTVLTRLGSDTAGTGLDSERALDMARRTGAGRAVLGSVVPTGGTVVISARLIDVARDDDVARSTVEGAPDALPALVDRLAAELLSLQAGEAQESLGSLTTTSLPALRAYLEARRDFRRGRFQEAMERAERALDIDSTFALAALTRIDASGFAAEGAPRAARIARREAGSLSRRDRIYLESMLGPGEDSGVAWHFYRERIPYMERAVEVVPDRPAAWYRIGDLYYHYASYFDAPEGRTRSRGYFERALALDSLFVPAGMHLSHPALLKGDTAAAIRVLERLVTSEPRGDFTLPLELLLVRLREDDDAADRLLDRVADEVSQATFDAAINLARDEVISVEDADRFAEAVAGLPLGPTEGRFRDVELFTWHLDRGRPGRAESHRLNVSESWSPESAAALAIFGALYSIGLEEPARQGVAFLERRLSEGAERAERRRCSLGLWYAEDGREARALEVARGLRLRARTDSASALRGMRARLCAHLIDAVAKEGTDAVRALERADSISRRGPAFAILDPLKVVQARVLAEGFREVGRPERALKASRRIVYVLPSGFPVADLFGLQAELAEEIHGEGAAEPLRRRYFRLREGGDTR